MRHILLLLLISLATLVSGQEIFEDIKFYADVSTNAMEPSSRARAAKQLERLFDEWIASESFSVQQLQDMKFMLTHKSSDDQMIITTWQVEMGTDDFKYYGYLFPANQKPIKLTDNSKNWLDSDFEIMGKEDWYGTLVYNMLEVQKDGKPMYILFGYDGFQGSEVRKIADVLTMENGEPQFGKEIFRVSNEGTRADVKTRLILQYDRHANVNLNYDEELGTIIHDHLIARMGVDPSAGITNLPDGSYVAYEFANGEFKKIEKVYSQTFEEPPSDGGVDRNSTSSKSLFGTPAKQTKKKRQK